MPRRLIALFLLLVGCVSRPTVFPGDEYLGVKYMASPLGEETGPDTDPLIRFDAFDCTTFVETVLAGGDVDTLNQIRYKNAEIGFLKRNHFIETDWLPNNANRVENVSAKYGKTAMRHVVIDKSKWLKNVHNIDSDIAPVASDIEYIPYDELGEINSSETLIVLFITGNSKKSDIIGTDLAVVHMGLLLPNGVLRHASSVHGRVVDVSFDQYVHDRSQTPGHIGVTLVAIK